MNHLPIDVEVGRPGGRMESFRAVWDTGAMRTAISFSVLKDIRLVRIGSVVVNGVHSRTISPVVIANIRLSNNILFDKLGIIVCDLPARIDVLLGMDIITRGDFAVSNTCNETFLSYRKPSQRKIDFTRGDFL